MYVESMSFEVPLEGLLKFSFLILSYLNPLIN